MKKIIVIIVLMSSINSYAQRFGIEDNVGVQKRVMNMEKFGLEIDSSKYFITQSANDTSMAQLYLDVNQVTQQATIELRYPHYANSIQINRNGISVTQHNPLTGGQIRVQRFPTDAGVLAVKVNGKLANSQGNITTNIFTPANTTDNTYPNGTMTADDNYLYFRKSDGTWVKIQWTPFNSL